MDPGGAGALAGSDLESPVLEPGGEWDVVFAPTQRDKEFHATGAHALVEIIYQAPGSGLRYRRATYVIRADDERWRILSEEGPHRIGRSA